MGHKGKLKKLGKSKKKMYGPTKLLICGYSAEEHSTILNLVNFLSLKNTPLIFAQAEDLGKKLQDILKFEHKTGFDQDSPMQRAIIMSGLTEKELKELMQSYKKAQMPAQLWATLTPTSKNWSLEALLKELQSEAQALKNSTIS
jgi:hypothetical protein